MKTPHLSEKTRSEYRRVAYYYYKAGLTQDMIAKRMQMSRQRVNRIVHACVDLGIVKITIEGMDQTHLEMEAALEKGYGLQEVRIVDNAVPEDLFRDLGMAAGYYLKEILRKGDVIGVTRGRTTAALAEFWDPTPPYPEDLTVTQLMGGDAETDTHVGVDRIVYQLAENLHGKASLLHGPVIVHSADLKRSFVEDPYYHKSYQVVKSTRIALVGIGTASSQWRHMSSLYNKDDESQSQWKEKVAGEVATHFFDEAGNAVMPPFGDRIIAITLEDYKKIPVRIGVAGGENKIRAIQASIKGGYINALITDAHTAELLYSDMS